WLARDQGGCTDVAGEPGGLQLPLQPVAAGAGLVDEHDVGGLALHPVAKALQVTLQNPDASKAADLTEAHRVRHGDRILVYIKADKDGVIVCHADLRVGKPLMGAEQSHFCGSGQRLTRVMVRAEVSSFD